MTREEERLGAALEFYDKHKSAALNVTLVDSFVYGSKWADKTTIDKASEWLRKFLKGPMGEGLAESIVDEFRKAMEE